MVKFDIFYNYIYSLPCVAMKMPQVREMVKFDMFFNYMYSLPCVAMKIPQVLVIMQ